MFKKLKNLIETYLKKTEYRCDNQNFENITNEDQEKELVNIDDILRVKAKELAPKQRIGIKYKIIANRTKSWRIRKKNMKRLAELGSEIEWEI